MQLVRGVVLAILLLVFFYRGLYTQVPTNLIGNNPSSLRWSQIKNERMHLIFPEGLDSTGQRTANLINTLWEQHDMGIGLQRVEKAPVLIQSQTAYSNGFVTVGPFRSELFPMKRQYAPPTNYLDHLAIHEYRHIQQFANGTKGISKRVKNVFGSWAWGGMVSLALPRWYFEGDAVVAETDATFNGRGRQPSFMTEYDALFRDGKVYNYEKAAAGSLKDFVPDWYRLGYSLMRQGQEMGGATVWPMVVTDAVKYKGLLYPFGKGVKKHVGVSVPQLYDAAMAAELERYEIRVSQQTDDLSIPLKIERSIHVTNYMQPKFRDGKLFTIRSGYDLLPTLVSIEKSGMVTNIVKLGRPVEGDRTSFSMYNNSVVWSQIGFSKRWRYLQYADLYVYDIGTKAKRQLTSGKRYVSPSFSPDGQRIIAIEQKDDLMQDIVILSSVDGGVEKRINIPWSVQVAYPQMLSGDQLIAIVSSDQMASVQLYDVAAHKWIVLTEPAAAQLSYPTVVDQWIYFTAAYDGSDQVYRCHLDTRKLEKVTSVLIGAIAPTVDKVGQTLYFTEMTSDGFRPRKQQLISATAKYIVKQGASGIYRGGGEPHPIVNSLSDSIFQVTKFNKWSGILKPHSLLVNFSNASASINVRSDNVFGTVSGSLGTLYNFNEDRWSYFAFIDYAELFPVLHASYVRGHRNAQIINFVETPNDTTLTLQVSAQDWTENRYTAGVSLPLNFSKGNANTFLNIGSYISRVSLSSGPEDIEIVPLDTIPLIPDYTTVLHDFTSDETFTSLDTRFVFSSVLRPARLQLYSPLGVRMFMRYRTPLSGDLVGGDVFNVNSTLYLPGLQRLHSFRVDFAYQKERALDNYRYGDIFAYPRGYDTSLRRDSYTKWGVNYSLPLWYPDIALSGFAFIKRVKASLFYDHGNIAFGSYPFDSSQSINSYGIELGLDARIFRLVEADFGIRWSRVSQPGLTNSGRSNQFEFFVVSVTQ